MHQFLVSSVPCVGDTLLLPKEEAHHAQRVLRCSLHEKVLVTDGKGHQAMGKIETLSSKEVRIKILEVFPQSKPAPSVTLFLGLLKGEKIEMVIQKCVELGLTHLQPFLSSRTVKKEAKQDRWLKIIQESTKQCHRDTLMFLGELSSFENCLSQSSLDADKLIFWEKSKKKLRDIFQNRSLQTPKACSFFIGPEGGFSDEEIDLACQHGYESVSLGQRILRAETAVLVATTLIQYELGNFSK